MRLFTIILCLIFSQQLFAKLSLPSFISSNMVLQQKKVNRIWGKANPKELVVINFNQKLYKSYANENGNWQVFIEPANAGKAGDMTITAEGETISFTNILYGEVWICSGQSNMEWTMGTSAILYKEEIAAANNDNIRFVVLNKTVANLPKDTVTLEKEWASINSNTIGDCSAVAYWYAKKLNQQLQVPIGLIITSWGGTLAQSWVGYEGLYDFKNYQKIYDDKIISMDLNDLNRKRQEHLDKYKLELSQKQQFLKDVIKPDFDDSKWIDMKLPGQWEEQGYPTLDGIAVYRMEFNVPIKITGKTAIINMPAIDDMDSTYINGIFIGSVNQWDAQRKYTFPSSVLHEGKNILIIKVQDDGGGGGLGNVEEDFNIKISNTLIPLTGKAKFNIVAAMEDMTDGHGEVEHQPTVLFNGMIAPLLPLSIKGVIWYQGESNADMPIEYQTLFPALIQNWRNRFGQGDFPFLFVQLSSFGPVRNEPTESNWALLREAQTKTLYLPNTAMVVTIDIGDPVNIHPAKKKEVGDRLAIKSLDLVYKEIVQKTGYPMFKEFKTEGDKIVVEFQNTGLGLYKKGTVLKGFAIAGDDKKFIWADAIIKGNKVVVSNIKIPQPKFVRYAWADSPIDANLYNLEGFPAVPFRTDSN